MAGRVDGKVALITGAARGIGRGCAELLAREGATVIVADVLDELGKETAAAIGGPAAYMHLDVTSEENWAETVGAVKAAHGRLDILVNNAGIVTTGLIVDTPLEEWRRITAVNFDGVFLGVKHSLPLMRAGGGGSIVNMSSNAAIHPVEWVPAYSAVKAAIVNFTQSTALQCGTAQDGVRSNAVLPGMVKTDLASPESRRDVDERAKAVVPLQRVGQPIDVAQAVLWLASDDSSYVTGLALVVDGGLSLRFPLVRPKWAD